MISAFQEWVRTQVTRSPSEAGSLDFRLVERILRERSPAWISARLDDAIRYQQPDWNPARAGEKPVWSRKSSFDLSPSRVEAQCVVEKTLYAPSLTAVVRVTITPTQRVKVGRSYRTQPLPHQRVELSFVVGPYTTVNTAERALSAPLQIGWSHENALLGVSGGPAPEVVARVEADLRATALREPPLVFAPAYKEYLHPAVVNRLLQDSDKDNTHPVQDRWMILADAENRVDNPAVFFADVADAMAHVLGDENGLVSRDLEAQLAGAAEWVGALAVLLPESEPGIEAVLRKDAREVAKERLEEHQRAVVSHRTAAVVQAGRYLNQAQEAMDLGGDANLTEAERALSDFLDLLQPGGLLQMGSVSFSTINAAGREERKEYETAEWLDPEEARSIADRIRGTYAGEFRALAARLVSHGPWWTDFRGTFPEPPDDRTLPLFPMGRSRSA